MLLDVPDEILYLPKYPCILSYFIDVPQPPICLVPTQVNYEKGVLDVPILCLTEMRKRSRVMSCNIYIYQVPLWGQEIDHRCVPTWSVVITVQADVPADALAPSSACWAGQRAWWWRNTPSWNRLLIHDDEQDFVKYRGILCLDNWPRV